MSIVKIIEVISEGDSIDAAIKSAVTEVSKTVEHVKQVNIDHIEALVENNKVVKFRVICKISFVVKH
jgi:dodecin